MLATLLAIIAENPLELATVAGATAFWLRIEMRLTSLEKLVQGKGRGKRESNSWGESGQ